MGLLEDIEKHFCVQNLYEAFGVDKNASKSAIKKAYRSMSLKHHPDKFQDFDVKIIENQTTKFQLLAKIHTVLSDDEKRSLYDEQGIVMDDDSMGNTDWMNYWRVLFPKITEKDIDDYLNQYINSEQEIDDLKKIYVKHKGDMNLICEHLIGFEEDRTRKLINELIDSGELDALPKFVNESQSSIGKRKRRIKQDAQEAEKLKVDDLAKALSMNRSRRQDSFDAMIANMEAKYGGENKRQKKKK